MKLAITAQGPNLDDPVDPRLGRARCFIVFDTQSGEHSVLDNRQNLAATQGAGVQAGQQLVQAGAQAVITGNCGPKAFAVLNAAGIAVYVGASGSVAQAIDQYKAGRLNVADQANVNGHWM